MDCDEFGVEWKKTQPIQWTERPTNALVVADSF
jgi:hypothetical protein